MFNEAGVNRRRKNILERAEASPRDHAEIKTKGGGQVPAHIHQSTSTTHHLQRILSSHCRADTKAPGTNCGNNVHVKRMRVFIWKGQSRKGTGRELSRSYDCSSLGIDTEEDTPRFVNEAPLRSIGGATSNPQGEPSLV